MKRTLFPHKGITLRNNENLFSKSSFQKPIAQPCYCVEASSESVNLFCSNYDPSEKGGATKGIEFIGKYLFLFFSKTNWFTLTCTELFLGSVNSSVFQIVIPGSRIGLHLGRGWIVTNKYIDFVNFCNNLITNQLANTICNLSGTTFRSWRFNFI